MDGICVRLSERYKASRDNTITIARCNIRTVKLYCVYCQPTIKLYPAKAKWLPVEYVPKDYKREEGYLTFIEQERSFGRPTPIESVG